MTARIAPVSLERTAWDLAVATGSLAYIEPQLADIGVLEPALLELSQDDVLKRLDHALGEPAAQQTKPQ